MDYTFVEAGLYQYLYPMVYMLVSLSSGLYVLGVTEVATRKLLTTARGRKTDYFDF